MSKLCTIGPRLVVAIERSDVAEVVRILKAKSTINGQIKQLIVSEVPRVDKPECVDVPLLVAAGLSNPAIIKHLTDTYKVDVNFVSEYTAQGYKRRKTALVIAVRRGMHITAGMILSLGADPSFVDHRGRTALHHAVRRADCRMARLLLANGARPTVVDNDGETPLHSAARLGSEELVMLLARHGADMYGKDRDGAPVIHIASRHGHSTLVRTLVTTLEMEADLRVTCYDGKAKAPIHVAAEESHSNMIHTLLLWCSANVHLTDSFGDTALHYSVNRPVDQLGTGSVDDETVTDTVRVLIRFGVPMNARNQRGETALHLAVHNRLTKAVGEMLSAGCDPLAKDNAGKRPIDLIPKDDSQLRKLLETATAQREKLSTAGMTPRRVSNLPCLSALGNHRSNNSSAKLAALPPIPGIADMAAVLQRVQKQADNNPMSPLSSNRQPPAAPAATASHASMASAPVDAPSTHPTPRRTLPEIHSARQTAASNAGKANRMRQKNTELERRGIHQRQARRSPAVGVKRPAIATQSEKLPAATAAPAVEKVIRTGSENAPKGSSSVCRKSASVATSSKSYVVRPAVTPAATAPTLSLTTTITEQHGAIPKSTKTTLTTNKRTYTNLVEAAAATPRSDSTSGLCKSISQVKVRTRHSDSVESVDSSEFSVSSSPCSQADRRKRRKHWNELLATLGTSGKPGTATPTKGHDGKLSSDRVGRSDRVQQKSVCDGPPVNLKCSGKFSTTTVIMDKHRSGNKHTLNECGATGSSSNSTATTPLSAGSSPASHRPSTEATPRPSQSTTVSNQSSANSSKCPTSKPQSRLAPNDDSAHASAVSARLRGRRQARDGVDRVPGARTRTVSVRRTTSGLRRPAGCNRLPAAAHVLGNKPTTETGGPKHLAALRSYSRSRLRKQYGVVSIKTSPKSPVQRRRSERNMTF